MKARMVMTVVVDVDLRLFPFQSTGPDLTPEQRLAEAIDACRASPDALVYRLDGSITIEGKLLDA